MSEDSAQVRVNFRSPFPLFPLERVTLLPHAMRPLVIFEDRYRQMVEHVLDGSGQIAMAVFQGLEWKQDYQGTPPLRPAVCVGRIYQHERVPDGRFQIVLQGICRARILEEHHPEGERLYRQAVLEPTDTHPIDETSLAAARESILRLLGSEPLTELKAGQEIRNQLREPRVPTSAALEIITMSVLTDTPTQYRLLAEGSAPRRAEIVEQELQRLAAAIDSAKRQADPDAPRGVVWN
ncbi:MAG: LON peptidase substrate-binding domain-containing protein [Phycisphaerales bacterium]|nr:LON peptidase substrate-binding domain-containing protein [Phycisphaerales bacterium]